MPHCVPGCELVVFAASVSIAISKNLSSDEICLLADLLSAISDNLGIIASQKERIEEMQEDAPPSETT